MAEISGRVELRTDKRRGKMTIIVRSESAMEREHHVPHDRHLLVHVGDYVEAGDSLTEGPLVPHDILAIRGEEALQQYLLTETQGVYRGQGQNINDKHFEIIIRKMMSKVQIQHPGDTEHLPGDLIDLQNLKRENELLLAEGKQPAKFIDVLLGITKASLSTDSFLSASSFQHTIKVLAAAAISSTEDPLYGLKENVIIGKLIPAGTGFERGRFSEPGFSEVEGMDETEFLDQGSIPESVVVDGQEETPQPTVAD